LINFCSQSERPQKLQNKNFSFANESKTKKVMMTNDDAVDKLWSQSSQSADCVSPMQNRLQTFIISHFLAVMKS